MINVQTLQLLLTGGVVGAVLGSGSAFTYLKNKGVNVDEKLTTVEKALDAVQPALDMAKTIAPLNPVVNIADLIAKWAETGVKNAEQLYHASQLTGNDDRKNAAKDTVYDALKEFNIEPTDNQQKLINDAIEASVNDLGHKDPTEAEKLAIQQQLQTQNAQLQAQNAQLQQTIFQAQNIIGASAASPVQQ